MWQVTAARVYQCYALRMLICLAEKAHQRHYYQKDTLNRSTHSLLNWVHNEISGIPACCESWIKAGSEVDLTSMNYILSWLQNKKAFHWFLLTLWSKTSSCLRCYPFIVLAGLEGLKGGWTLPVGRLTRASTVCVGRE